MSPENEEYGNSLLNDLYRQYLRSDTEPDPNHRKLRERMRNRIRLGVNDFALANQYCRNTDIRQIFQETHIWHGDEAQIDEYWNQYLEDNEFRDEYPNKEEVVAEFREKGQLIERSAPGQQYPIAGVYGLFEFVYRGLRMNEFTPSDFESILEYAFRKGEASVKDVDIAEITAEVNIEVNHHSDYDDLSPYEKLDRGLQLTGEEVRTVTEDLKEKYKEDFMIGKDYRDLVDD